MRSAIGQPKTLFAELGQKKTEKSTHRSTHRRARENSVWAQNRWGLPQPWTLPAGRRGAILPPASWSEPPPWL